MSIRRLNWAFGTVLALTAWCMKAKALDESARTAARNLVNEGATCFKAGQFEQARRKFTEALSVAEVPTVAVWAAQTDEKLGKLVEASDLYERALLMQPGDLWVASIQRRAQEQAERALKVLKPRIPTLRLNLAGVSTGAVNIAIDNTKVPSALLAEPLPVDPGTHAVTTMVDGTSVTDRVILYEGQEVTFTPSWSAAQLKALRTLASAAKASPAMLPDHVPPGFIESGRYPRPQQSAQGIERTTAWVVLGVGATGLAVGTTAGIVAGLKRSALHRDGCLENSCFDARFANRVDDYNSWRTASTVGFVVSGASAVAGFALLFASREREPSPRLSFNIRSTVATLAGEF